MKKILLLVSYILFTTSMYGQGEETIINMLIERYKDIMVEYIPQYKLYNIWKSDKVGADVIHLYGCCDEKGNEIFPPKYGGLSTIELYCIFAKPYANKKGYVIIDNQTLYAKKWGLYGVIDDEGKLLVPCIYSQLELINGTPYAIAEKGGEYFWDDNYDSHITKHGKWGIIDVRTNQVLTKFQYDYIDDSFFRKGDSTWEGTYTFSPLEESKKQKDYKEARIRYNVGGKRDEAHGEPKGGKWGYLDINGKVCIPAQYESASNFENGYAQVYKNGVTSLIALDGSPYEITNGGRMNKIDENIPLTSIISENTFAFIIANENYNHLNGADYSINDGKTFAEYCRNTLGVPEKNVRYYEDASYGNIQSALKKMQDIADVYDGEAKILFYYSGLGATSDKDKERYLLPIDISVESIALTGYSVTSLQKILNELKSQYTIAIIDAPFSNRDKLGRPLFEGRGVAVKPKTFVASENTIFLMGDSDGSGVFSDKPKIRR